MLFDKDRQRKERESGNKGKKQSILLTKLSKASAKYKEKKVVSLGMVITTRTFN